MAPHFAGRGVDSPSHRQIPIRPRVDLSRSVIVEVRLTTGRTSRAEPITIGDPPPGDTPLVHLVIKMHKEAMTKLGHFFFITDMSRTGLWSPAGLVAIIEPMFDRARFLKCG